MYMAALLKIDMLLHCTEAVSLFITTSCKDAQRLGVYNEHD